MDLEKLEVVIRRNLISKFEEGNSIGISFPCNERVKLVNYIESLSIIVELREEKFLYCEVKSNFYHDLNMFNTMYECVKEAIKYLSEIGEF